jgi:hypothetical protein
MLHRNQNTQGSPLDRSLEAMRHRLADGIGYLLARRWIEAVLPVEARPKSEHFLITSVRQPLH